MVWASPLFSISGHRYYVVLIDDFLHYCWLFPLKCKSDVRHHKISFLAYTKNQFQLSVKAIQADNGREFVNHALTSVPDSSSILLRLSCPYTSPQNGKAEHAIHTINNVCRTLLIHAHMPPPYWAEAALTAAYLLNRQPCSAIGNSIPFEHLFHRLPDYNSLRVFGCLCYPNLTTTTSHKLAPCSTAYVYIGYPTSHKGYQCLELSSKRIIISRHVVFDESSFPLGHMAPPTLAFDFLLQDVSPSVAPLSCAGQPQVPPTFNDPAILLRGPTLCHATAGQPTTAVPCSLHQPVQPIAGGPRPTSTTAGTAQPAAGIAPAPPRGSYGAVYESRPHPVVIHGPQPTSQVTGTVGSLQPPAPPPSPMQGPPPPVWLGRPHGPRTPPTTPVASYAEFGPSHGLGDKTGATRRLLAAYLDICLAHTDKLSQHPHRRQLARCDG
jgi:hypothetical protein